MVVSKPVIKLKYSNLGQLRSVECISLLGISIYIGFVYMPS